MGIVPLGMDRHRRHAHVAGEDVGRTVALVNVEVDDEHPFHQPFSKQDGCCDRDIVEDAKPRPLRPPRVVAAASRVEGDTVFERQAGRVDRAAGCRAGAKDDALAHRKPDLAGDARRHGT